MKKILVALAMFPALAFGADLSVGTFELNGGSNLGFLAGSREIDAGGGLTSKTDVTQYGLEARGLYFVTPNLSFGARFKYESTNFEDEAGFEDGSTDLFFGPAVQYQQEVAPKVALFGVATLGYVSQTSTSTGSPDETASGFGFGLGAGVKYFLVNNFSFNAGLVYDWQQVKGDAVAGVEPKTTASGFGLQLGLSVYFGGK